jgi:hypothetical protein
MRFEYFYKTNMPIDDDWADEESWDVLISAYNSSERVGRIFDKVCASTKIWLIFPHYDYSPSEYPKVGNVFFTSELDEAEYLNIFFDTWYERIKGKRVCVDITGFMRPHLIFLVKLLQYRGIRNFDAIYSDPGRYQDKDDTKFANGPVTEVRPVAGYGGVPNNDSNNDILLMGVGYDHELLKQVVDHKDYANVLTLWGFPSLRADMYQESVIRASQAHEAAFPNGKGKTRYFAPANDPFVTAARIQEIVTNENNRKPITNLYLSPLATKAQVLGFALYCLYAKEDAISLIFPFSKGYAKETSKGISSIWKYSIELPEISLDE